MFWRLSHRSVPILFLALSGLWTAGIYLPFLYSIAFPNVEIQHLVKALEGREPPRQGLSSLVRGIVDSNGHLKRTILVGSYHGVSAEFKSRQWHTSKETEFAYLAWFEKRSNTTILIVNLTEIDESTLRFDIREGKPLALARIYLLPLFALAFSVYWFRRVTTLKHVETNYVPDPLRH